MITAEAIRNATFDSLRESLDARRIEVYRAWQAHGPCTTRELAQKSGIDLLTVRPRTSELLLLGLVTVSGHQRGAVGCGIYSVTDPKTWTAWREQNFPVESQMHIGLTEKTT
jgi:hypothetical protein